MLAKDLEKAHLRTFF